MLKSNVGSVFFWRGGPESFEFDGLFSSRNAWYLQDFLLFGASHTSKVIFQNTPRKMGIKRRISLAPHSLCLAAVAAGNMTGHDGHRDLLGKLVFLSCSIG